MSILRATISYLDMRLRIPGSWIHVRSAAPWMSSAKFWCSIDGRNMYWSSTCAAIGKSTCARWKRRTASSYKTPIVLAILCVDTKICGSTFKLLGQSRRLRVIDSRPPRGNDAPERRCCARRRSEDAVASNYDRSFCVCVISPFDHLASNCHLPSLTLLQCGL